MHSLQSIVDKNKAAAARDAAIERSNRKRTEDNVVNDRSYNWSIEYTLNILQYIIVLLFRASDGYSSISTPKNTEDILQYTFAHLWFWGWGYFSPSLFGSPGIWYMQPLSTG